MENINFEMVLSNAVKLPMVKIDRESFLRKELNGKYSQAVIERAVAYNPAYAGIKVEDINKLAKSCIRIETKKVTVLSAAAGVPGGFAMIGTIPLDIAQYFAHILRVIQKLMYLYGWQELVFDTEELNDETKNLLVLFIGVMFGINSAVTTVSKLVEPIAQQIMKKLPQKALTKGTIYPIVKKVASLIGIKMTKEVFAKNVAKIVPVAGALISGTLTYATFNPMSNKLMNYLSSLNLADVDFCREQRDTIISDGGVIILDEK